MVRDHGLGVGDPGNEERVGRLAGILAGLGHVDAPAHALDLAYLEGTLQLRPRRSPGGDRAKVVRGEHLVRFYVLLELQTDKL